MASERKSTPTRSICWRGICSLKRNNEAGAGKDRWDLSRHVEGPRTVGASEEDACKILAWMTHLHPGRSDTTTPQARDQKGPGYGAAGKTLLAGSEISSEEPIGRVYPGSFHDRTLGARESSGIPISMNVPSHSPIRDGKRQ